MSEKLTCTKVVRRDAGRDAQSNKIYYSERCGAPASEVEISGILTSVKAVLCSHHAEMARDEAFVSKSGFGKGQVDRRDYEKGYRQIPFPGLNVK